MSIGDIGEDFMDSAMDAGQELVGDAMDLVKNKLNFVGGS